MTENVKGSTRFGTLGCSSTRRFVLFVMACLLSVSVLAENTQAQFYGGYRHHRRGAVVIAPQVYAGPYSYGAWGPPPVVTVAPSIVRIRTPFFSMNLDPGGYFPPPYPYYGYTYDAYRPRYDYGYASARPIAPGFQSVSPDRPDLYRQEPRSIGSYRPGMSGGIPDVSRSTPLSMQSLRDSAERLRFTLERRPDDGEVWLDYLKPELVVAAIDSGQFDPGLNDLEVRYQGVTMNPDLIAITRLPGFMRTQQLLSQWVQQAAVTANMSEGVPQSSPAPTPQDTPEQSYDDIPVPVPTEQFDPPVPEPAGSDQDEVAAPELNSEPDNPTGLIDSI